jgi:hypothetical protein
MDKNNKNRPKISLKNLRRDLLILCKKLIKIRRREDNKNQWIDHYKDRFKGHYKDKGKTVDSR